MGLQSVREAMNRGLLDYTIEEAMRTQETLAGDQRDLSELYAICSQVMFKKAQYTDAAGYGRRSIQSDPGNPIGYSALGWAEYWLGRNRDAVSHLEKAAELAPDNAEIHYRLGSIYSNALGKLQEAEVEFSRALELDEDHILANQQRAICRDKLNDDRGAESDYRKASELGDSYSAYCLSSRGLTLETPGEKVAMGRDCWAQNDRAGAVDYLRQALEDGIEDPGKRLETTLELADKLSIMKLNDEAVSSYSNALEIDPRCAEIYGRRGWHYYCSSADELAEKDLLKALQLDPHNSLYSARLGSLYAVSGRAEEGLEILDPAAEMDPLSPDIFYSRALCHKVLGNDERAKADFVAADLLGHRNAMNDRRSAYGDEYPIDFFSAGIETGPGNPAEAVACFRRSVDMFREKTSYKGDRAWRYWSKSLHNLGYYLHVSGSDDDEAVEAIEKALEMDPGYFDAWITLGNIHNTAGRDEKAMECYTSSIELKPNEGRGYYSRGRIYMAQKKYDEGVDDFTKAINFYRRRDWQGDAFYNRARCHEGAGRIQEAIEDYNQAFNNGIQSAIQESFRLKDQYGME